MHLAASSTFILFSILSSLAQEVSAAIKKYSTKVPANVSTALCSFQHFSRIWEQVYTFFPVQQEDLSFHVIPPLSLLYFFIGSGMEVEGLKHNWRKSITAGRMR